MSEEQRRMLEECQEIYHDKLTIYHIHDESAGVFEAATEIMKRIDQVLERER